MGSTSKRVIFVRECRSSRFLDSKGGWVETFDDAARFFNQWQASDFCREHKVRGAEIVLRLGDAKNDVIIGRVEPA